jgi:hypothetical protein
MYLIKQSQLKSMVLSKLHASSTARNSSFTKTYQQVKSYFLWNVMKQDIWTFVAAYDVYQYNKGETFKSPGTPL